MRFYAFERVDTGEKLSIENASTAELLHILNTPEFDMDDGSHEVDPAAAREQIRIELLARDLNLRGET